MSSKSKSICDFFAKKPPKLVSCPVCSAKIPLSSINRHLDNADECRVNKDVDDESLDDDDFLLAAELTKKPRLASNHESLDDEDEDLERNQRGNTFESCVAKYFSSSPTSSTAASPLKSLRISRAISSDPEKFLGGLENSPKLPSSSVTKFSNLSQLQKSRENTLAKHSSLLSSNHESLDDEDEDIEKNKRGNTFESCVAKHFSSSPTSTSIVSQMKSPRISRAISSDPKKFLGGLENSPELPPRSVSRFSNLSQLQKSRRSLAFSPSKAPEGHVPFTQSKRTDPGHVPYYVVNFEYVVSNVIDGGCDDRDLFEQSELDLVEKYRGLSLDCRKVFVRLFQRKLNRLNTLI